MKRLGFALFAMAIGSMCVAFSACKPNEEIKPEPETRWDVSESGDNSVVAKISGDENSYRLEITGNGKMKDFASASEVPWEEYSPISGYVIGEGVTKIGSYALYAVEEDNFYLPSSVTEISSSAFPAGAVVYSYGTDVTSQDDALGGIYYYSESVPDDASVNWWHTVNGETVIWEYSRVLFIGNSFTYYYEMPEIVDAMAEQLGIWADVDWITYGGRYLDTWLNENAATDNLIGSTNDGLYTVLSRNDYTHIVLQGQSQEAYNDYSRLYNAVKNMQEMLSEKQSDAEIFLYSTWGYDDGSTSYGSDIAAMEAAIRDGYNRIGEALGLKVNPVGTAFTEVWKEYGDEINLYASDNKHDGQYGAYLSALVHTKCLFNADLSGLNLTSYTTDKMQSGGNTVQNYTIDEKIAEALKAYARAAVDGNEVGDPVMLGVLATPSVSVLDSAVYWSAIDNANYYEIYLDGEKTATVTGTAYSFDNMTAGTYSVSVKAFSDLHYRESGQSETVTVTIEEITGTRLETPQVTVGEDSISFENLSSQIRLSWDAIENATGYAIYVDGVYLTTVTQCEYSFSGLPGTYNIGVSAVAAENSEYVSGIAAVTEVTLAKYVIIYYNGTDADYKFVGDATYTLYDAQSGSFKSVNAWNHVSFNETWQQDGFSKWVLLKLEDGADEFAWQVSTTSWNKDGHTGGQDNRVTDVSLSSYVQLESNLMYVYVVSGHWETYADLGPACAAAYELEIDQNAVIYSGQSSRNPFAVSGLVNGRVYYMLSAESVSVEDVIQNGRYLTVTDGGFESSTVTFENAAGTVTLYAVATNTDATVCGKLTSASFDTVETFLTVSAEFNDGAVTAGTSQVFTLVAGRSGTVYYLVSENAAAPDAQSIVSGGVQAQVSYGTNNLTMAAYNGAAESLYVYFVLSDENENLSAVYTVTVSVTTEFEPSLTDFTVGGAVLLPGYSFTETLKFTVNGDGNLYYALGSDTAPAQEEMLADSYMTVTSATGGIQITVESVTQEYTKIYVMFGRDGKYTQILSADLAQPVKVSDESELLAVLSSDYASATIILTADITMTEAYSPKAMTFKGLLDGYNYKIINLTFNVTSNANVGLFRNVGDGAVIRNIVFENASATSTLTGGTYGLGLIAGKVNSAGTVTLENIAVMGFTVTTTGENAGGLIGFTGYATELIVKNCYVNMQLTFNGNTGYGYGGVIAKMATSGDKLYITDTYIEVSFTSSVAVYNVGAFMGQSAAEVKAERVIIKLTENLTGSTGSVYADLGYCSDTVSASYKDVAVFSSANMHYGEGASVIDGTSVSADVAQKFTAGGVWNIAENADEENKTELKFTVCGQSVTVCLVEEN